MSGGRVLYTGAFRFPDGDAAAARVLGVGKSLRVLGYSVEYLGWETDERLGDQGDDGYYRYDGFRYRSMGEFSKVESASPVRRTLRFLSMGERTLAWLRTEPIDDVKAIIVYHGGAWFLTELARFCRGRGIRLLFDCTEWYDPRALAGGPIGPAAIDSEIRMRWVYPRMGKGIAISRYLEKHFQTSGCQVVRLPPCVDFCDTRWREAKPPPSLRERLRLVYAGSPGKKDLLLPVLLGLSQLKALRVPVLMDVIGPSENELSSLTGAHSGLLACTASMLRFSGRIPQGEVPRRLMRAHFSVLVRPDKRYARAGFSTKLVESLSAGVPVIANAVGEVAEYIKDGFNGVVVADSSPESFVEGVLRARGLSDFDYSNMRRAAGQTALSNFDCAKISDTNAMNLRNLIG